MISPNKNILIIDNQDSFTFNLVQAFEELGCFVMVSGIQDKGKELFEQYQNIVFSPGPGLPNDFPIMFDILKKMDKGQKILGICLGHQAIAQFFGAYLFRQLHVQHGQKKRIINQCNDQKSAMYAMPPQFDAGLYHSWAVDKHSLPVELEVSCVSEDNIIMGIYHKHLYIEGIQFHPESFLTPMGSVLLKNWLEL